MTTTSNPFQNAAKPSDTTTKNNQSGLFQSNVFIKKKGVTTRKVVAKKQKKLPKDAAWFKKNKLDTSVFNEPIKDSKLEKSLLWAIYRAQVTELEGRGVDMSMFT